MMIITIPLPMQGPPHFINSYLIKDGEDSVLIDTGLPTEEDIMTLTSSLTKYGYPRNVIITHYHPDHIGLVRLFKNSNIIIHEKELEFIHYLLSPEYSKDIKEYLSSNGFPDQVIDRMLRNRERFNEIIKGVNFITVKDGDKIEINGTRAEILWTPGHTVGHICLMYDHSLFCGDHILPDITPNASILRKDDNPLKAYLNSLEKIKSLNVDVIYPAHGKAFSNVKERIREIIGHHDKRLDEIIKIIRDKRKANAYEIATGISWYKKWDELSSFDKQLALGETMSHLKYLVEKGSISEIKINNSIYYTIST
ncbi:MBL fold metallo-hydrolase [Sulfolobus sp. C3]|nr:MBL fold metallo-hydrolase [Sulfolobus sp. C3]